MRRFFAHSLMSTKVIFDLNFFLFGPKIHRDCLSFMYIGVFSIYGKILLRILLTLFYSVRLFSVHAKILMAYLETTSFK